MIIFDNIVTCTQFIKFSTVTISNNLMLTFNFTL